MYFCVGTLHVGCRMPSGAHAGLCLASLLSLLPDSFCVCSVHCIGLCWAALGCSARAHAEIAALITLAPPFVVSRN